MVMLARFEQLGQDRLHAILMQYEEMLISMVFNYHIWRSSSPKRRASSPHQRAKMRGYIREWKTSKMLLNLAFIYDILSSLKKMSIAFQKEGLYVIEVSNIIAKTLHSIPRSYIQKHRMRAATVKREKGATTRVN